MMLHAEVLEAEGAPPQAAAVFLHGILGTGGNLRTVARRLQRARPGLQAVLVDLRAHGRSQAVDGEDTIHAAAADVREICVGLSVPVRAVVGHSFGGKVALLVAGLVEGLEQVVTIDSNPGAQPEGRGSDATVRVVKLLRALEGPWPTREAFVREVEARGESLLIARWLAMNLRTVDGPLRFGVDLARVWALLGSYFDTDAWGVVERAASGTAGPAVHLLVGETSSVYAAADRARAQALAAQSDGRVSVDVLPAGHWVHVDAPDALHEALLRRLP